eukprot:scpid66624/ scgid12007/ 
MSTGQYVRLCVCGSKPIPIRNHIILLYIFSDDCPHKAVKEKERSKHDDCQCTPMSGFGRKIVGDQLLQKNMNSDSVRIKSSINYTTNRRIITATCAYSESSTGHSSMAAAAAVAVLQSTKQAGSPIHRHGHLHSPPLLQQLLHVYSLLQCQRSQARLQVPQPEHLCWLRVVPYWHLLLAWLTCCSTTHGSVQNLQWLQWMDYWQLWTRQEHWSAMLWVRNVLHCSQSAVYLSHSGLASGRVLVQVQWLH